VAGIYLHIPFCRKACTYCDFHFSTNVSRMSEMADAIVHEVTLRKDFFAAATPIDTVYFGGGTPSLLHSNDLGRILDTLRREFFISPQAEITLEANPDDLDLKKLNELRDLGINRLSIGVQSFREEDLQLLNRSHNAKQSLQAVRDAQEVGFENITLDLIYGIPGSGMEAWEENIQQVIALKVPHVSAYSLTVEPKTALHHQIAKGKIHPEPDEAHVTQYFRLIDALATAGIHQYELSNFARDGFRSRHNSAYWKGAYYLGLGPSAHSFNGESRSWNVSNNARYLVAMQSNDPAIGQVETLSATDQLNEYLMTQLRIVEGVDLDLLRERWQFDLLSEEADVVQSLLKNGWAVLADSQLRLTRQGFMVSDSIISDLFRVEE
jgi:oxygen-independent coproporphyrinogen III oxidase